MRFSADPLHNSAFLQRTYIDYEWFICQFKGYCCVRASDPPTWRGWPCWNNSGDGKSLNFQEEKFRNTRTVVLGRKGDAKGAKDKVKGKIVWFFFYREIDWLGLIYVLKGLRLVAL